MANLSITYYPGDNFNFATLSGCVQIGSCVGAPGTSQSCDNGEVGGFLTPTGKSYLRMGSFSSPRVASRSAYAPVNLKYCESITCNIRAGNDSNGGERPNNNGEDFFLAVSDGGFNAIAYATGSNGSSAYGSGGGAKDAYWESWRDVNVTVPSSRRQSNGYLTFASDASSSPEFGSVGGATGGKSALQNAGDTYGLASFTLNLQIPTPTASLVTNRTAVTIGIDSPTFTWNVGDAESRPTLTEFSDFPDGQLNDPSNNNIGSGSGTRVPTLTGLLATTGTKTYTLSVTNRLSTSTASVAIKVVGIPTATLTVNGIAFPGQASVTVGDVVTLAWTSTWGFTRSIDQGVGSVIASGSTTRTITSSGITTFTFTVVNEAGYTVTATATAEAFNPPVINSITTNPVIPDQDSTFSLIWDTTDASSVSIPGVGSGLPVDGNQSLVATVDQSGAGGYPGAPSYGNGYRDYTITACNPTNTCVSQTLRVFIKPQPPRITLFSISPSEVNFGGTVTFTWTTIYSLTGSINSSVGATTPIASGTKTATITGNIQDFVSNSTKTYTMSVTGYGGTESNSYNVNVLIDTTPDSWIFTSKTGAAINTTYYASSNTTSPL